MSPTIVAAPAICPTWPFAIKTYVLNTEPWPRDSVFWFQPSTSTGDVCAFSRKAGNYYFNVLAAVPNLAPHIVVEGLACSFVGSLYNSYPRFSGPGGEIFLSAVDGHFILNNALAEPHAEQNEQGVWEGDGWWRLDGLYFDTLYPGTQITAEARGVYKNEGSGATAPTISIVWPRWEQSTYYSTITGAESGRLGIYTARDGATPERILIGSLRFDQAGTSIRWTQSADGRSYVSTGGDVLSSDRAGTLWTTSSYPGTRRTGEWYQTTVAPDRENGATLVPMKRETLGGEAVEDGDRDPIVLTFRDIVSSDETQTIYMAEVALWR